MWRITHLIGYSATRISPDTFARPCNAHLQQSLQARLLYAALHTAEGGLYLPGPLLHVANAIAEGLRQEFCLITDACLEHSEPIAGLFSHNMSCAPADQVLKSQQKCCHCYHM